MSGHFEDTPTDTTDIPTKTSKLIKAYNNVFKAKMAMEDMEMINAKMDGDFHRLLTEISFLTDKELQYERFIRRIT